MSKITENGCVINDESDSTFMILMSDCCSWQTRTWYATHCDSRRIATLSR